MASPTQKLELTWHPPRTCWKKKRGGRIYYLATGQCRGRSDRQGYQTALREWRLILADLLTEQQRQPATIPQQLPIEDSDDPLFSTPDDWGPNALNLANYNSLLAKLNTRQPASVVSRSITELIDQFLSGRRIEAESGQITVASWDESRCKLAEFRSYCDAKNLTTIDQIDGPALEQYRGCQLLAVTLPEGEADKVSATTAKKRLASLRQFLDWCHRMGTIPMLPANLPTLAKIKLAPPRPQFFTLEECRTLFNESTRRTKLYIALALNLGFTQTDIASLTYGMVDWSTGIVTRERQKTGMPQLGKLWPVTLELLEEQRSPKKDGPLLVTQEGGPLLINRIKGDGIGRTQVDSIRLSFNRVLVKAKFESDSRGFRHFRKTGADWIAENFQDRPHLTDLYLAHASAGMRRHYARQHFDALFEATDALGKAVALKLTTEEEKE